MCTNFVLPFKGEDPVIVSGRTIDFSTFIDTKIEKFPRNAKNSSISPGDMPKIYEKTGKISINSTGKEWTNEYGYLTTRIKYTPMVSNRIDIHGMNEKGLTVGLLFCGGSDFLKQTDIEKEDYNKCLMVSDVVPYLLGTSASVEDVQEELVNNVLVWNLAFEGMPDLGYHFAIYDKNGNGLIAEYKMKKQLLYKNVTGVLSNEPFYEWQTTNLNYFYNSLTNKNSDKNTCIADFVEDKGLLVPKPTSSTDPKPEFLEVFGSGMDGLPGNCSSASRFVRGAKLSGNVPTEAFTERPGPEVPYATQMVQRAMEVIDRISAVEGEILVPGNDSMPDQLSFTQLKLVTDHTNNVLYYSYDMNHNYQQILLDKLNWDKEAQTFARDDRVYNDSTSKLIN